MKKFLYIVFVVFFSLMSEETIKGKYIFIEWEEVEGAKSYNLQISDSESFTNILFKKDVKETQLKLPPNENFRFGRVAGIDGAGIRGEFSDIFEITTRIVQDIPKKKFLSKDDKVALDIDKGEAKEILFNLNQRGWERYLAPFPLNKEGINLVQYYSVNKAGAREETKTAEFLTDFTPPEIKIEPYYTFQYGTNELYTNGSSQFKIEAFDKLSGVTQVNARLQSNNDIIEVPIKDGVVMIPTSFSNKNTFLIVTAMDAASNKSSKTIRFFHDEEFPIVNLFPNPEVKKYYTPGEKIIVQASDLGSGVRSVTYSINSSEPVPYLEPIILEKAGEFTIKVFVTDNSNNTLIREVGLYKVTPIISTTKSITGIKIHNPN
ncbi:MAG: hypothetical protein SFU98_10255 [Leptospiraceae bacterium]|nr:hypothetical protein [Leptospiraceae bacterium]